MIKPPFSFFQAWCVLLLACLLAACNPNGYPDFLRPATAVPVVSAPSQTPARPTVPAAAAQLSTPTQPAPQGEALNETGPWLTFLADSTVGTQMIALNPDGSGRTVLGVFPDLSGAIIARPTGPGSWFSLYNGRNSTLTVFGLPHGGTLTSFSLLSHPDLTNAQKLLYAGILGQQNPPAQVWSPDGGRLAFIGAMDGGFTDLYIYNPLDSSQSRLTGNIGESSFPVWSPDGSAVLVQELLMNPALGTYGTQTVYYLSVDGVTLRTLYAPASQYEQIFGWIDPNTFVVASQRPAGFLEARRYLLEERKHTQLKYAGAMDLTAFSPEKAVVAFTAQPKDKNAAGLVPGLYWTSPNSGPVTVERGNWHRLTYLPAAGRFFAARSGAVLSFYPGIDPVTFADEDNLPAAAPDGTQLAFWSGAGSSSPGLRLYGQDGVAGRGVTSLPVSEAVWTLDSSALFFVSRGDLYRVNLPDGEPVLLGASVSNLGWVGMP